MQRMLLKTVSASFQLWEDSDANGSLNTSKNAKVGAIITTAVTKKIMWPDLHRHLTFFTEKPYHPKTMR